MLLLVNIAILGFGVAILAFSGSQLGLTMRILRSGKRIEARISDVYSIRRTRMLTKWYRPIVTFETPEGIKAKVKLSFGPRWQSRDEAVKHEGETIPMVYLVMNGRIEAVLDSRAQLTWLWLSVLLGLFMIVVALTGAVGR